MYRQPAGGEHDDDRHDSAGDAATELHRPGEVLPQKVRTDTPPQRVGHQRVAHDDDQERRDVVAEEHAESVGLASVVSAVDDHAEELLSAVLP